MKRIGSYEAKAKLSEILRQVEEGETVIVTRHGQAIAKICPVREDIARNPRAAMARLLASKATLGGHSLRELREMGRRR
jgi:prevent-host-death family protein